MVETCVTWSLVRSRRWRLLRQRRARSTRRCPHCHPKAAPAVAAAGRLDATNFDSRAGARAGVARARRRLLHAQRQGAHGGAGAGPRHRALSVRRQRHRPRSRRRSRRAISSARSRRSCSSGAPSRSIAPRSCATAARAGRRCCASAGTTPRTTSSTCPGSAASRIAVAGRLSRRHRSEVEAAVTYILIARRDPAAHDLHLLQRPGSSTKTTTWGTLSDTGARIETVPPVASASARLQLSEDIVGTSGSPPVELRGAPRDRASPTASCRVGDPTAVGASLPIAGVDVEVYDAARSVRRARRERGRRSVKAQRHGHARGRAAGRAATSPT